MNLKDAPPTIETGALEPLGLLPRWLAGQRLAGRRVVSTLLEGHPLLAALEAQRPSIVTCAPRAAIEPVPIEGPLHWLPRDSETAPPIVLGPYAADVAWAPSWRLGLTDAVPAKIRTVDALAGESGLGAVLLGGGDDPASVAKGAAGALRSSACPVVFDLGGLLAARKREVLQQIADALPRSYRIHNAMLQPLTGDTVHHSWFVAGHESNFSAANLALALALPEFAGLSTDPADLLRTCAVRESRSRALEMASRTLRFDESVRCSGFYRAESDDKNAWRWLGPQPRGIVCLARPFWGAGHLELRVIGTSARENLTDLRLIVDGEVCRTAVREDGESAWRIGARFTSRFSMERATMNVGIHVPTVKQVGEDPRRLGIAVAELRVSR